MEDFWKETAFDLGLGRASLGAGRWLASQQSVGWGGAGPESHHSLATPPQTCAHVLSFSLSDGCLSQAAGIQLNYSWIGKVESWAILMFRDRMSTGLGVRETWM